MVRNEIQEIRMKEYFIDAAREILKGEGLKSISVRNIAERAGYSYATLYNYFNDVKDLIFECVKDFQKECDQFVEAGSKNSRRGLPRIKSITKAYINYFVQYPGIFELFFIESTNDFVNKKTDLQVITGSLNRLCEPELIYCVENEVLTKHSADKMINQLLYSVVGLLTLYINRRQPKTYKEFMANVETELTNIINK
ncbi:MAG: TetR/AcrR family transcriptional regulator [Melioribacteraceae bacterium]|nr:TetR/AcrR family transcriptional regulator [Melioribacteraceae bacterium]MCF8356349.1 TetR/AcrR family transcriptional regulator [Melioribacteraceae bacterium]MCF8395788.1 TetR/AcrR family transcriptional regulator [Melioribacteraceae bacterium]MCF8420653.1 TetR/AcrR family transcriptional regulator [Melioribacteraceae bacterium]